MMVMAFRFWIILFSITVIKILMISVRTAPSASAPWRGSYTQSTYYYSDYSIPKTSIKKSFLPGPQYCPETGRTVCTRVKPHYPIDAVFDVLSAAKARRFNLSSEFMDESENDEEPNLMDTEQQRTYGKPKNDGYVLYQTVHYDYNNSPKNRDLRNNQHNPMPQSSPNYYQSGYVHHDSNTRGYNSKDNNNNNQRELINYNNGNNGNRPFVNIRQRYASSNHSPIVYPSDIRNDNYEQLHQQQYTDTQSQMRSRSKRQSNNNNDSESVCSSRMILVEPKAALNDRGQWKYIVNLSERDPRLKQAIKVEVCISPNTPCSNQISLPFGFVSRCRQKYIKKKLLALDSSGQSISSENFFAPSCCVCEIVRNTGK